MLLFPDIGTISSFNDCDCDIVEFSLDLVFMFADLVSTGLFVLT